MGTIIDDAATDRIYEDIDASGSWDNVREQLKKKHGKWTNKQLDAFSTKIVEKYIEIQDFDAGVITKKYTKTALSQSTGYVRAKEGKYKVIKDINGVRVGRLDNIKVTTRKGKKVYVKNIKTGKKARIR